MSITVVYKDLEEMKALARELLKDELGQQKPEPVKAPKAVKEPEPVKEPVKKPEPVKETAPEPAALEKTYSKPEARKILADLRAAGKKDAVTALIREMGYEKFPEIPDERIGELVEKARAL